MTTSRVRVRKYWPKLFHLWIVFRFVTSGRRLLNLPSMMALAGMALGVASLTVAMGVVSGYEKAMQSAITDVFGHVMLVRRGDRPQNLEEILKDVKKSVPEAQTFMAFFDVEGMIVSGGKLAGVHIQGVDPEAIDHVLNIRTRLIRGDYSYSSKDGVPAALVGKALVQRFNLKVGESFKVVIPKPSRSDSTDFSSEVQDFYLAGVLDLGKAEYDQRVIIADIKSAQALAGVGERFTGIRVKLTSANAADAASLKLASDLGPSYYLKSWTEVERNLFEAIKIERVAIFFVILVMVVAASFNISSNLFVSVLQKYSDISILRTMGFAQKDVRQIFMLQGLFFGLIGTVVGLVLGLLLGLVFVIVQKYIVLLPVEAYRIDHVGVEIRLSDLLAVVAAAIVVCLISTFVPARRGSKLDPVEGLRYE